MQPTEEMRSQVHQVLERFNELVSTRNLQVLAEFTPGEDVILVGSESGEVARGKQALKAFFTRVFAREVTFSWEWEHIDVSHAGDLAWFFAEGRVVLSTPQEQRRSAYRISGVLERHGARWLWRQYHGSEPVLSE
jgi:ketosteroid isomerase-like protein